MSAASRHALLFRERSLAQYCARLATSDRCHSYVFIAILDVWDEDETLLKTPICQKLRSATEFGLSSYATKFEPASATHASAITWARQNASGNGWALRLLPRPYGVHRGPSALHSKRREELRGRLRVPVLMSIRDRRWYWRPTTTQKLRHGQLDGPST